MPTIEELKQRAKEVTEQQVTQTPQTKTGFIATGPQVPGHEAPIFASQQQTIGPHGDVTSNPSEVLGVLQQSSTVVTFYSRYNGTQFCMPSGRLLSFIPYNGMSVYQTEEKDEIIELMKVVKASDTVLTLTPTQVKQSDAHILREVGVAASGLRTGAASSQSLSALSRLSTS